MKIQSKIKYLIQNKWNPCTRLYYVYLPCCGRNCNPIGKRNLWENQILNDRAIYNELLIICDINNNGNSLYVHNNGNLSTSIIR